MEKLEKVQRILSKKLDNKTAWEKLSLARMIERPTALDYIERIFDSFIEFHGDRCFSDDASVVGGIALLDGMPVTIVAHQKGRNTAENIKRNFGSPNPEGYRKGLRLMKQAEKFGRPVICMVDTQGAYCGKGAEERGQGEAIAKNLLEMSKLKTPIISIVIGEGGSGGALAFAVADDVWMLENSVYSVLSPEGFASILWKDASRAKEAAEVMKITAKDLKEYGIIDKVIKEPSGGAHKDVEKMAASIKEELIEKISVLKKQSIKELLDERYSKFRNMGEYME
ncbi:acetyl-CoA carboxylase carboxyltransferase subunit alpha [Clostridium drakei]|uniref:acetyl-CoA carboxylase carboxyltransferase subunit alpha n=1 Tax=Clostridium drakei TaxID=332101 RepID=UPI0005097494|nr:acetyl-CoA carboxylase carboxyltransferase subunit alpha [Clostridium drakei]